MKKVYVLLIVIFLVLSVTACDSGSSSPVIENDIPRGQDNTQTPEPTQDPTQQGGQNTSSGDSGDTDIYITCENHPLFHTSIGVRVHEYPVYEGDDITVEVSIFAFELDQEIAQEIAQELIEAGAFVALYKSGAAHDDPVSADKYSLHDNISFFSMTLPLEWGYYSVRLYDSSTPSDATLITYAGIYANQVWD